MDNEEILEIFIDKLVEAKIENFKLNKKNKDLENMNKASNEIIKNLKLEITTLRNNIKL
jgi:hypothetical protein